MGAFLDSQREPQAHFKQSRHFSTAAQAEGVYKQHRYPFCLPVASASENLFDGIREPALDFFERHAIQWHDGGARRPSNHLCNSQVCCVNFLFPFSHQPQALADLLRPLFPTLTEMLPVEDGSYVSFEWIGGQDYLHENRNPARQRVRGANFTSADAAVKFRHVDGQVEIALIEWKFTEFLLAHLLEILTQRNRPQHHLQTPVRTARLPAGSRPAGKF